MEIKVVDDGMWGGVIPDVLRNNRITLKTKNLEFTFENDEFDNLRKCLDDKTQELFNIAQGIIKESDAKDKIVRDMRTYIDKLNSLYIKDFQNGDLEEIWENLTDLYANYWNVDYKKSE